MNKYREYWWVSHNQTFESEIKGYMWSPKRNKNGAKNIFYDNMTKAEIGDLVFSFASSEIQAVGLIDAKVTSRDRPAEFSSQWDKDGWYVGVNWLRLKQTFRPKKYIDRIGQLLPQKYSPLRETGDGLQGVYLAELGAALGSELLKICSELNPGLTLELDEIS